MEATETAEAGRHKQTPRPVEAGEGSPPLGGGKEPRSPHPLGVGNLEHMEDRSAMQREWMTQRRCIPSQPDCSQEGPRVEEVFLRYQTELRKLWPRLRMGLE